jgi:TonB-linked SusC/RagA family outer membrane protein
MLGRNCQRTTSRGAGGSVACFLSLCVGLMMATSLQAQTTGTVTGQVTDPTQRPVEGAQVFVAGLNQGGLTRANGRYIILNLPAGTHELTVQRLGFSTVTEQLTITVDGTTTVDFQLATEALGLDEIVVTGTAGQARRREVGNSIVQLNIADIQEPVVSTYALLQGRAAGVMVHSSSGVIGDATKIRIRGNVSAALSNDPLIYIDGVRVRSEAYTPLATINLGAQYAVSVTPGPLDDINPNDIERIEIIKGAAATTLYGTEAAAGVIQIFTKKGRSGAPQWSAASEVGVTTKNVHGTTSTLRGTPTRNWPDWDGGACWPQCFTSNTGGSAHYLYLDAWMRDRALQQKHSMSVRGSAGDVFYFMSGSWEDDEDVFVTAGQKVFSLRSNFQANLSSSFNFDFNAAWNSRDILNIGCGDDLYGICARSSYGGIIRQTHEDLDELVYDPDHFTQIDRFITGGTLRFQPGTNFSTRFTMGYDRAMNQGRTGVPFGFSRHPKGINSITSQLYELVTIDLVSTYNLELSSDFNTDLSVGFQRVDQNDQVIQAETEGFPGPGETTLSSGATTLATERKSRIITGGLFGQAVFKYQDKYFLTAGVRADGNSAFGQDFGWQIYPKFNGSYIISDESGFPEALGVLKLRGAWGTAGRAPGAFDAVRTWASTPWGGQSSFAPNNLGNDQLGPERTAEWEVGMESSTFNDRLYLDFTYYKQVTTNALVSVGTPPSQGDWTSQLENIGKLQNTGLELSITATVIEGREWSLDVGGDISTNHSMVISLGDAPSSSSVREGEPFRVPRGFKVLNPDEIAEPIFANDGPNGDLNGTGSGPVGDRDWFYFGPHHPTLMLTPRILLRMPKGLVLAVRGEYNGGAFGEDGASRWAMIEGNQEYPMCWDAYPLIAAGQQDQLTALERVRCLTGSQTFQHRAFIYSRDFFKLREVSLVVPLGFLFPGASRSSLTLAGRNLFRWVKSTHKAYDPESGGWVPGRSSSPNYWQRPAPPKVFTMAINVTF